MKMIIATSSSSLSSSSSASLHCIHHGHLARVAANSAIVHMRHSKVAANFAIRDRLVSHLRKIIVLLKYFCDGEDDGVVGGEDVDC